MMPYAIVKLCSFSDMQNLVQLSYHEIRAATSQNYWHTLANDSQLYLDIDGTCLQIYLFCYIRV